MHAGIASKALTNARKPDPYRDAAEKRMPTPPVKVVMWNRSLLATS